MFGQKFPGGSRFCLPYLAAMLILMGPAPLAAQDKGLVGPSAVSPPALAPETLRALSETLGGPDSPAAVQGGMDVSVGITRNEPAVAVNPLDPDNVAVAGLFSITVSTDGGATFLAPTPAPVPATHGRAGDPSLAFDSRGRLFWTYLGIRGDNGNIDVFVSEVDPSTGAIMAGYPVNVTAEAGQPASSPNNNNDKEWLAADRAVASPFRDRLYVTWTNFTPGGTLVQTTFSTDQGQTWSQALTLSQAGEGFVWPVHNAVSADGDVYVAYHSQPTFVLGAPDGTGGQIFVLRSQNGGVSFGQKTLAFDPGEADITFNVQSAGARVFANSASWTQGSAQPWLLPDPLDPENIYVVAADDPTDTDHGAGFDDMNVYIARSGDRGVNWAAPLRVDSAPAETIQFFPTAGIDERTGCISVTWYDTRAEATNAAGNFLLDLFTAVSKDGGQTFGLDMQLNDAAFDPDLGAPVRFAGPPRTRRIGEYNGVAVDENRANAVWTGNTATGQQILFDRDIACLELAKTLESGPDVDGDGRIDVVIEVGQPLPTEYDFDIAYFNPLGPDVRINDTTPAEWQVTDVAGNPIVNGFGGGPDGNGGDGTVDIHPANKKPNNRSATKIEWLPDADLRVSIINVVAETRGRPPHRAKRYAPTSCGALHLNDGAAAFELDSFGESVSTDPLFESNRLCLAAVEDPGLQPGDRGPEADTDGDGLADFAEACTADVRTDPCRDDTDGDGVVDGVDACSLEGPPTPGTDEVLGGDGCIVTF